MNLKQIALAVAAGSTLLAAAPVFAQSHHNQRWNGPSHGWRAPYHRPYYGYGYGYNSYYRAPAYAYMPPAPAYYTPEPYYYAPRAPVVYGRLPLGHHSSVGFSLPLY